MNLLIEMAKNDAVNYAEMVAAIAATVQHIDGANTLSNDVFETVCGLPEEVLNSCINEFDEENGFTGHCHDSWSQNNAPDFADYSALGEWDDYDMESVQEFMQDVLNAYVKQNS